jgi:hypothetical protein
MLGAWQDQVPRTDTLAFAMMNPRRHAGGAPKRGTDETLMRPVGICVGGYIVRRALRSASGCGGQAAARRRFHDRFSSEAALRTPL